MSVHMTTRGDVSNGFEAAAKDLERAAAHLRQAAEFIHDNDLPHTCVQVIATQGELAKVNEVINAFIHLQANAQ